MIILGIESSCDETGLALYDTEKGLLAHALHSQIDLHRAYGGVVPELASRDHIRRIMPLLDMVLKEGQITLEQVDAIAYTAGPGLGGALLVGASLAQTLAWSLERPLIPIHHLEGHLLSPLLAPEKPKLPFVALLVSGGHTQIMQVDAVGKYVLLGETLDDAAGEAFDKSAKCMGLPYPGGPILAKMAEKGNPKRFDLPRPMLHSKDLDFSFSGLKTAVLTQVNALNAAGETGWENDMAASVQAAIIDVLCAKALGAVRQTGYKQLVVAGGVGANVQLRSDLSKAMEKRGGKAFFPPLSLCTDNGAMIAHAAAMRVIHGLWTPEMGKRLPEPTVRPRWPLDSICA